MGTASSVSITMLGFLAPCLLLLAALAEGRPQEEWATYKATYGKEYSEAEDLVRYSRWLYNKEVVDTHNSGDHSYKMALMEYSDWTEEEMAERRLGYVPAPYDPTMELETFETPDFAGGAKSCMTLSGLGKLSTNMILIGFKNNWKSDLVGIHQYMDVMYSAFDLRLSFAILRCKDGLDFSSQIASEQQIVREVAVDKEDPESDN